MSSTRKESKRTQNDASESRLEELKRTLRELPTVNSVKNSNEDIEDETLVVDLDTDMVEPMVEDSLDEHSSYIKRAHTDSNGTLTLNVGFEPKFEYTGKNSIRKRGGSYIVAISPEAAKSAGFELGDNVEFYSRNGEVIMKND